MARNVRTRIPAVTNIHDNGTASNVVDSTSGPSVGADSFATTNAALTEAVSVVGKGYITFCVFRNGSGTNVISAADIKVTIDDVVVFLREGFTLSNGVGVPIIGVGGGDGGLEQIRFNRNFKVEIGSDGTNSLTVYYKYVETDL